MSMPGDNAAISELAIGEISAAPVPSGGMFSSFSQPMKKTGFSAAVVATIGAGFVAPPPAPAPHVFSQFSQPAQKPLSPALAASVQFEVTPPVFVPPPPTPPAVFSSFSQPIVRPAVLPSERPSALFEAPPQQIITPVFTRFSQPAARPSLPAERPNQLLEVAPPSLPPFTGFAQFSIPVRPVNCAIKFASFQPTQLFVAQPDTHDLVLVSDQFRKKKRRDPIQDELDRRARLRADLELAVYGPEVTYEPQRPVIEAPKAPPNVGELAAVIMRVKEAEREAQRHAIDQDDEDVIELILRNL